MNNKPLDKNFLKNRKKSLDEFDKQVFDRFKYIMKRIGVAYKAKISERKLMKYVKDYLEEAGDYFIEDYLQAEYLFYASDVLPEDDDTLDFMIPTKWFYEEFESDLAKLVKKNTDYDRSRDATIESIKSKLTKKELEILGLK